MIESFTIQEEKFIDQTYYVKLGVKFDKKKIYNYLEKNNIFPSQIKNEKFLFLPLIIDESTNDVIFYANNPLYENWNLDKSKNYLINFLLPTEDLEDLNLIKNNVDNIENYNFKEIIKKYNLNNSIVSIIFRNKDNIKVLSKIFIEDKEIILNNSFKNYDLNNQGDFSKLVWFLANQKKIEKEKKFHLRQRILHNQDKTIREVLQQQAKLSKLSNAQWKFEYRRQENFLKKQYEIDA